MISNLNQSSEAFLANVERVQRSVEEASRQVSSGKRVNVASDAPDEIDTIMQLQTGAVRSAQIQANLSIAKTEADAADSALNSATKIMDRATTLATQGATFSIDASGRQSLADEVQSLLEQMVSVSRTTVQGRYIFGGDQDSTPPYDVDLTAVNGVARLTSAAATRRVEDASGSSFATKRAAQDIFDARNPDDTLAANNVFAALNSLRVSLLANDDTQIAAAALSIKDASAQLNVSQAFYGTVQNRIQDATSYASSYSTQLKVELGSKQDADVTAAALALTQGNAELQAAFAMQAKMPRTTLFDFMA
jgi:flagellar hook-associated protein 3 FlgL